MSRWLQEVSQATLQGVLSYFHIGNYSAVGLSVSESLSHLQRLSLLGAKAAECYRLREARTPCESRCCTGCFHSTHGTYFAATWWMLHLAWIIRARVKVESSRHWCRTQKKKQKNSEPGTHAHSLLSPLCLCGGLPWGKQGCRTPCAGFLCPNKQTPSWA